MSERAIPTKRHFDSLQCLTNALHKKSFYLGSPGSSSPDESTCLGLCAWPRWLYIPLLLPPLETGSRLSVETGNLAFRRNAKTPIFKLPLPVLEAPADTKRVSQSGLFGAGFCLGAPPGTWQGGNRAWVDLGRPKSA